MNFRNIIAVALVLALASCSKDKSAEKGGGNNDTASYQPATGGSMWHYKDASNPEGGFTLTATGRDTVVAGIPYHIFVNKPDTSASTTITLLGQDGKDYYAVGLIGGLGDNAVLYLRDTTLNAGWSQNMDITVPTFGDITAEMDFQLTGVNGTKKLNGKTYSNVATVALQLKVPNPVGGGALTYATGSIYFARGVGVIEVSLSENGSVLSDVTLDSYTIH